MKLFGNKKTKKTAAQREYTAQERAEAQRLATARERMFARRRIILAVMVVILLVLCIAIYVTLKTNVKPPETVAPEIPESMDAPAADPSTPVEGSASLRKEGFYTFVIVGLDDGNGNTDTILVGSLDTVGKKLNVISLPRDTLVNVERSVKKINAAYGAGGIDELKSELKDLLGFTPDSYAAVNLKAFKVIVDTIGGVDFDVPFNMNYDDPYQDLHIHIGKGLQHLDGTQSLQVVRWRQNNDGSGTSVGDAGRIEVQHSFLKALAKQCLTIGNITKVNKFAEIFSKYVKTSLTVGNIVWYGTEFLKLDEAGINFYTIPAEMNDSVRGLSYVTVYVDDWVQMINDYLNPYKADITEGNLNILTRNASGDLYSTSGEIKGGVGSFYNASHSESASAASAGSSGGPGSSGGEDSGPAVSPPQISDMPAAESPDAGETPETTDSGGEPIDGAPDPESPTVSPGAGDGSGSSGETSGNTSPPPGDSVPIEDGGDMD